MNAVVWRRRIFKSISWMVYSVDFIKLLMQKMAQTRTVPDTICKRQVVAVKTDVVISIKPSPESL